MEHEEINIQDLYPELSEAELKEAGENLRRYLKIVNSIYNSLSEEDRLKIAVRLEWEKRFKGKKSAS